MSGEFKHFENASPSMFAGPYMQLHEFLDRRQEELLQKGDEARDRIDSLEKLHTHIVNAGNVERVHRHV